MAGKKKNRWQLHENTKSRLWRTLERVPSVDAEHKTTPRPHAPRLRCVSFLTHPSRTPVEGETRATPRRKEACGAPLRRRGVSRGAGRRRTDGRGDRRFVLLDPRHRQALDWIARPPRGKRRHVIPLPSRVSRDIYRHRRLFSQESLGVRRSCSASQFRLCASTDPSQHRP